MCDFRPNPKFIVQHKLRVHFVSFSWKSLSRYIAMQNTLTSQNYNNQPPEFTPYTESLTPNPERDNEI
jgi:hypothetical protein